MSQICLPTRTVAMTYWVGHEENNRNGRFLAHDLAVELAQQELEVAMATVKMKTAVANLAQLRSQERSIESQEDGHFCVRGTQSDHLSSQMMGRA